MRYDDFLAEYDRAHDDWSYGNMPQDAVGPEIARLRALVPQIEETNRRSWAENLLTRWQSYVDGPAMTDQVKAISVDRLRRPHGETPSDSDIEAVRFALRRMIDVG